MTMQKCFNMLKRYICLKIIIIIFFFVNKMSTIYIIKDMAWLRVDVISLDKNTANYMYLILLSENGVT